MHVHGQMADHNEVMAAIQRKPGVVYSALTPNVQGLDSAVSFISTVINVPWYQQAKLKCVCTLQKALKTCVLQNGWL